MKLIGKVIVACIVVTNSWSQVLTKEDSLTAGLIARPDATVLSGYGSFRYTNNVTTENAEANVDRVVLFLGHKFSNKISFFSEMELENAKLTGGSGSGEFSMEQAFIKFNLNRSTYLTAGLFIPRIGIINENHLPNTYNGATRPLVETLVIPSTWREIGIGIYGYSNKVPGLNYSFALVNGLNAAGFTNGSGIREGRFEGRNANASSLALTGALLQYIGNFRLQCSAYLGGSAGLSKRAADSLQLNAGAFGTPVALTEINAQYTHKRWYAKVLATFMTIPDAAKINQAYANNTALQSFGAYAEVAYTFWKKDAAQMRYFARYETLDLNAKLPENGVVNPTLKQQYLVTGISFLPVAGVIVKVDYVYRLTGNQNPNLVVDPYPVGLPYFTKQHAINIGLGYSF